MRRFGFSQRPQDFELDVIAPLAQGLVFAGLGGSGCAGSVQYADASGYGNHGTLTNMDPPSDWLWIPELGRWGLDFDGTDDWVPFYSERFAHLIGGATTNPWTLAVWARTTTVARQVIMGDWTSDGANETIKVEFGGYLQPNNQLSVSYCQHSPNVYGDLGDYAANTWYHIAVTYDGASGATSLTGFVNGAQTVQFARNSTLNIYTNQVVTLGRAGAFAGHYLSGRLSDPVVYRRALSPPEIQQLADPSNVMLSGLLTYRRKWWPVAGGAVDPPDAPTDLTATAVSSSRIDLSWTHDGLRTTHYEIQRTLSS